VVGEAAGGQLRMTCEGASRDRSWYATRLDRQ
jgi:hypothetical protein